MTAYGAYEHDKPHPPVVEAARRGDLLEVKRLLKDTLTINVRRKRLEVEEKWGYDKSWTWDDDTALIAAPREGHHSVVLELLSAGADPTLTSCPEHDVHETVVQAVDRMLSRIADSLGRRPPRATARQQLEKRRRLEAVKVALAVALEEWPLPVVPKPRTVPLEVAPESMTVVQLRDVLRRHRHKIGGLKAELVARVKEHNLLPQEVNEQLKVRNRLEAEHEEKRAEVQQRLEAFKARLCSLPPPAAVTDDEVAAVAGPDPAPPTLAPSRRATQPAVAAPLALPGFPTVRSSRYEPPAKRARFNGPGQAGGQPTCCGRTFKDLVAIQQHQRENRRCPSYTGGR